MELHQLRGFLAVVQENSFTKAAEKLHLTQPALSLQIKGLESELGLGWLEQLVTSTPIETLRATLTRVGAPTTLYVVEEADHGFRVAKKSGRTPEDVQQELLNALEGWIRKVLGG